MIDRKKRNENIMYACADVFYEKGIEKATMRNFSEAIGYSPATIYQSYKDKRSIVENCLYFCVEKRNAMVSDILIANKENPGNLLAAMKAQKDDLIKWSTIILRIITSPYYEDMKDSVIDMGADSNEVYEKDYDAEVMVLFSLYFSAIIRFSMDGNAAVLEKEEAYLERQMASIVK
ncbi:MAG: TetR/AcrR family transcriptional regulator [Firmicutes bacterium]|nr:TetR/AcrR family transcriptional regulator [Bacillota bacterium]